MLGIIGGSGWDDAESLGLDRHEKVVTAWGAPSAPVALGDFAGVPLAFLPRHGADHRLAPHQIDYRANIAALREVGVTRVLSLNAVGGIARQLVPGDLVVPHQLVDYTWGRAVSFHPDAPVLHLDFTDPFDERLRAALLRSIPTEITAHDGGIYAVTQGPRFETAAEIDRLERDGCTVVGMTAMPEAYLAREAGLRYVVLAMVANLAAGRGAGGVELGAVEQVLADTRDRVVRVLASAIADGL